MPKKIGIASDHAGFELKNEIVKYLKEKGHKIFDMGTFNGYESVDYPDFACKVAEGIKNNKFKLGILICGTGIGMAIMANRYKEVRAANCNEIYTAKLAREHNNANVLTIGARVVAPELAIQIVETFLNTPFSLKIKRHLKRVLKLSGGCHKLNIDK